MRKTLTTGAATVAAGGVAVATATVLRTAIIVEAGLGAANVALAGSWALAGIGALVMAAGAIPAIRKAATKKPQLDRAGILATKNDPAVIRNELQHQKSHHPALIPDFDKCIAQLDNIEKQQAQLEEVLLLSNAKESWDDVSSLLVSVQDAVCENLKPVILFGISFEDQTNTDLGDFRMIINEQLGKNYSLLGKCSETRKHVASLISANKSSSNDELEAYLLVLRDMVAHT
ncbi:MAG: hypothetical protein FWD41_04935 [Actinomycetia bacterium]|nr:hypothetical protein [Actinomycetes bacterium]